MTYTWRDRRKLLEDAGNGKTRTVAAKTEISTQKRETKVQLEKRVRALAKTFTIRPSADNVIIKRLEGNLTESGLVVVKTEQRFIPSNLGLVMAVGDGKMDGGVFVPTKLKVGDKVWFHLFPSGCEVQEERDPNETYIIIAEKQCVGVVGKARK